jgi:hypothetical protein
MGTQDEDKKTKTIQRNWQYRVYKTKTKKTKTMQRNWQYKVHKTQTRKLKESRETGNIITGQAVLW